MKSFFSLLVFCLWVCSAEIQATHGTIPVGFGTKSIGMGGVAAAYPQDTIISAINPAGMCLVPHECDIGLQVFMPFRKYSFSSTTVRSGRNYFFVPHLGYSQCLNPYTVCGFSFYGQGGMNTHYPDNNPVFGQRKLGIDYLIATFAPTIAFQIFPECLPCQFIGIAPLLGFQLVKVTGLQNFAAFSIDPNHVSNKNYDFSYGIGVRAGWLGRLICFKRLCSALWGGVACSTPLVMSRFHKYAGLFPARGRVNIPGVFTAGLKLEVGRRVNVAFDYQRIFYSNLRAFNNPIEPFLEGVPFGRKDGAGFGWQDVNVYKVGVDFHASCAWTLRAGGSFGTLPYDTSQMDFNIIAPAVTKAHVTGGATWRFHRCHEFDLAYAFAFRNRLRGFSRIGLGEITHTMIQHLVELNYAFHF